MGNLCGKESKPDPFSQPGRALGSAPPPQTRASVPKVGGQGRMLGGAGGGGGEEGTDARSAAAKAAEERAAKSNQPKGKLGKDLATQRAQTRTGTLESASEEQRQIRSAAQAAEARNYN